MKNPADHLGLSGLPAPRLAVHLATSMPSRPDAHAAAAAPRIQPGPRLRARCAGLASPKILLSLATAGLLGSAAVAVYADQGEADSPLAPTSESPRPGIDRDEGPGAQMFAPAPPRRGRFLEDELFGRDVPDDDSLADQSQEDMDDDDFSFDGDDDQDDDGDDDDDGYDDDDFDRSRRPRFRIQRKRSLEARGRPVPRPRLIGQPIVGGRLYRGPFRYISSPPFAPDLDCGWPYGCGDVSRYNPRAAAAEIERRMSRQRQLIHYGWHSGVFAPWQAQRLRWHQMRIGDLYAHFAADNYLAPHEYERISRFLDRVARHMHRAWANARHRYRYRSEFAPAAPSLRSPQRDQSPPAAPSASPSKANVAEPKLLARGS